MKAYKGFESDLSCKGFQYEIGGTYEEPNAILCECGFHACTNPLDVFRYYHPMHCSRFCEVEAENTTNIDIFDMRGKDSKISAKKIRIVKELTMLEMIDEFRKMTPGNGFPIHTDYKAFSVSISNSDVHSSSFKKDIEETIDSFTIGQSISNIFVLRVGAFNDELHLDMIHGHYAGRPIRYSKDSCKYGLYGFSYVSNAILKVVSTGNKNNILSNMYESDIISVGDDATIRSASRRSFIFTTGKNATVVIAPTPNIGANMSQVYCSGSDSTVNIYAYAAENALVGGAKGTRVNILSITGEVIGSFQIDGDTFPTDCLLKLHYDYYLKKILLG